jgi:hypothetical protein
VSSTGEIFLNGQGDGTQPKPIARAFLAATPNTPTGLDFFEGFTPGTSLSPLTDTECGATPPDTCWQQFRRVSADYDTSFLFVETERNALGVELGELWTGLADAGSGSPGRFRFTPRKRAEIESDAFLYVSFETSTLVTGSRYPQLVITDTLPPIEWTAKNGRSLVLQSVPTVSMNWPNRMELQVCDHVAWEHNLPCPIVFDSLDRSVDSSGVVTGLAPALEVAEHSGVDRATQWELFVSTTRAYVFLDGKPLACANLPAGAPSGEVSVTFGYVLGASGNDPMDGFSTFLAAHGQLESHRHFDNLAFRSGAPAPAWDEVLLPCF